MTQVGERDNSSLNSNHEVVDFVKDTLEIYAPFRRTSKLVSDENKTFFELHNPNLLLLFNSDGFSMGQFPPLMREFSEILHLGPIGKCNILKFYDAMRKFSGIQQRWGI